jgi:hypothetical protein
MPAGDVDGAGRDPRAHLHCTRVGEMLEAQADVLVGAGATHAERFGKVPPLPGLVPAEA